MIHSYSWSTGGATQSCLTTALNKRSHFFLFQAAGMTLLMTAAYYGRGKCLRTLLGHGADVNALSIRDGVCNET